MPRPAARPPSATTAPPTDRTGRRPRRRPDHPNRPTTTAGAHRTRRSVREPHRASSPPHRSEHDHHRNPALPLALAVDLGGTKVEAALVTDEGVVLSATRFRSPTGPQRTSEELQAAVDEVVVAALAALPAGATLVGVGVGSAGPVDEETRPRLPLNMPVWRGYPLRDRVAAHVPEGVPVTLRMDGLAITLAEHWVGAAQGSDHVMGMIVSTGVGGGLILHGRTVSGPTGNAGHIGHVECGGFDDHCACGGTGCLEAIASGPKTVAWAQRQGFAGSTGEELSAAYAAGDEIAVAAVQRSGRPSGRRSPRPRAGRPRGRRHRRRLLARHAGPVRVRAAGRRGARRVRVRDQGAHRADRVVAGRPAHRCRGTGAPGRRPALSSNRRRPRHGAVPPESALHRGRRIPRRVRQDVRVRRSRLLTSDDWPESELRGAVLAGELVAVGPCWASPPNRRRRCSAPRRSRGRSAILAHRVHPDGGLDLGCRGTAPDAARGLHTTADPRARRRRRAPARGPHRRAGRRPPGGAPGERGSEDRGRPAPDACFVDGRLRRGRGEPPCTGCWRSVP